jgi:hypothetical protein
MYSNASGGAIMAEQIEGDDTNNTASVKKVLLGGMRPFIG